MKDIDVYQNTLSELVQGISLDIQHKILMRRWSCIYASVVTNILGNGFPTARFQGITWTYDDVSLITSNVFEDIEFIKCPSDMFCRVCE